MICRFSADAVRAEATPVDNRFILDYMPHASGLQLSVYLYGLMQCRYPSDTEMPLTDALGLSEPAVTDAFRYWQQQGLVRIKSESPLSVEYLALPEAETSSAVRARYHKLVSALNALTDPRRFGMRELNHVYDWVEVYRLEEDAVLELVSHCMDEKGKRVSVNYIDAVAQTWSENGIVTRADALRYVERANLKKHGASAILREWNKFRKPTKAEIALYEKWTGEWGFDDAAILAALPRLNVAGTPNFGYLDELLDGLRQKNSTDAETIQADDRREDETRAFARLVFERAGKAESASRTQRAQIAMYLNEFHMPRELLLFGAEQCRGASEPFGLMKKLWTEWHDAGVDTLEKAEADMKRRGAGAQSGKTRAKARQAGYEQHGFTNEELDKLLVDLDQDL